MKITAILGSRVGLLCLIDLISKKRSIIYVISNDKAIINIAKRHKLNYGYSIESLESEKYFKKSDLIISIHNREIVPKRLLSNKFINLHPYLYCYKGANPIGRAIEAKNNRASVGAHVMTDVIDSGEVLLEKFKSVKLSTIEEAYSQLYPLYIEVMNSVVSIFGKIKK